MRSTPLEMLTRLYVKIKKGNNVFFEPVLTSKRHNLQDGFTNHGPVASAGHAPYSKGVSNSILYRAKYYI